MPWALANPTVPYHVGVCGCGGGASPNPPRIVCVLLYFEFLFYLRTRFTFDVIICTPATHTTAMALHVLGMPRHCTGVISRVAAAHVWPVAGHVGRAYRSCGWSPTGHLVITSGSAAAHNHSSSGRSVTHPSRDGIVCLRSRTDDRTTFSSRFCALGHAPESAPTKLLGRP